MKIRTRITLWIAGVALLSGMGFSCYVVYELIEVPYLLIDRELQRMATELDRLVQSSPESMASLKATAATLPFPPEQYWIRIRDRSGRTMYKSPMAAIVDIDTQGHPGVINLEKTIPRRLMELGQDSGEEVLFRVLTVESVSGPWQSMVVAKPIEDLERIVQDMLLEMAAAIAFFVVLVVSASYLLAGRILAPLVLINRTARQISDSSLDHRIPLGKSHDETYDLSVSLNKMFDRLQYSFIRQREFIGNAAHELKSPITLLLLSHEELLQSPGLGKRTLSELQRQVNTLRRMSRLVKNLLDLSRLEQQAEKKQHPIDLHLLLSEIVDEYAPLLHSADIQLVNQMPEGAIVSGDREQLQRLFVNLVDNAWRYNCTQKGEIRITGQVSADQVTVEIANTGPGVSAEETELVFEQFYRVEKSRSLAGGGSGLGLTIARTIVRLHDGEIRMSTDSAGWTRVVVTLPPAATAYMNTG